MSDLPSSKLRNYLSLTYFTYDRKVQCPHHHHRHAALRDIKTCQTRRFYSPVIKRNDTTLQSWGSRVLPPGVTLNYVYFSKPLTGIALAARLQPSEPKLKREVMDEKWWCQIRGRRGQAFAWRIQPPTLSSIYRRKKSLLRGSKKVDAVYRGRALPVAEDKQLSCVIV